LISITLLALSLNLDFSARQFRRKHGAGNKSAHHFPCLPNQPWFHIYGTYGIISFMKQDCIRTTVDIPAPLYRRLKAQAAANGRSVRELVLAGVQSVLLQARRPRPQQVQFPLIDSPGPKVDLTNEQIYEHVEFP
jgi:hypothetical protein